MYFIFFKEMPNWGRSGIDTLWDTLWATPVESMGKEVPKGGGDLSDLLKSVTVIVF
jgi:hypothetical protein